MSVIVRMERVPKNCDDGCWGSLSGECPWCDSMNGYKMVGYRPPNCPIIAVLPEGHGRLGDLDALREFLIKAGQLLKCQDDKRTAAHAVGKIIERIDSMSTIVPAERSET